MQGVLWMLGAQASFIMMAIAGRELSDTMNTFQIMLVRSLTGFFILICIIAVFHRTIPTTNRLKLHIFRNTMHYSAQAGWFFGVSMLPLATVFAIEFTTPIWVAAMAILFLGERLNSGRLVALIFGFGGTLIILRPHEGFVDYGSLGVLWAAIGFASVYIITKILSSTETPLVILFWMLTIQVIVGLIPGVIVWVPIELNDIIWIGLVGIGSLTAHYSVAKAVTLADVLTIMPLDFLRLPVAALIGFLFYSESIEVAIFIGAVVIFVGNYYNIRFEQYSKKIS